MTIPKLGTLKQVELREFWPHEALNFTKWLALPQNLELLADELGIDIVEPQVEAPVGKLHVDILADDGGGKRIVIENQLEACNHSHLGQIVSYAAGLDASYVVWVVREARDEFQKAIEWLNERTDEDINFFLVQIELWQIDESSPAPKFHVICRPNDWVKAVRTSVKEGELSETHSRQLEFWQGLRAFSKGQKDLKLRTPRPQHWYDVAIGRSDCHVTFTLNSKEQSVGCEIYIENDKDLFRQWEAQRESIEKELSLSEALSWQLLPEKKASRIRVFHPFNVEKDNWDDAFKWLLDVGTRMKRVFSKSWQG